LTNRRNFGLAVPRFGVQPGVWTTTTLGPVRVAAVESEGRTDTLDQTFRIAVTVGPDGGIAANLASVGLDWSVES
jgi:hypothetical protein